MELDLMLSARDLRKISGLAQQAETAGFGAIWFTESGRTAYLSSAAAALATQKIGIGTAVAVAFPRSPMVTAGVAWELAEASNGRFVLGLGTQVQAHVVRRYSAEFSPPGPRLRDYVKALKAIFAAFRGEPLDYEGEFYEHTLLPPQWSPGAIGVGDPPIYISAVGPYMSKLAGELCDGVHVHPFHSLELMREVQIPKVAEGAAKADRTLEDITFVVPVMTAVGHTDGEIAASRDAARTMIAFYGTTRSYSAVFEREGFDGLSAKLHERQRAGDITAMVSLITDDVLDRYCTAATWDTLADALAERYSSLAPNMRLMSYTANQQLSTDPEALLQWTSVIERLREYA